MNADKFLDIFIRIIAVAMVTTVLMRGSQAAKVISAIGDAFSGSLRTAMGR